MISESEQSEWEEVTDNSDMELKADPTPSNEVPNYMTPTSQHRDELSSLECELMQTESLESPIEETIEVKQELTTFEQIEEEIKMVLMDVKEEIVEETQVAQVAHVEEDISDFGGYPIRPEVRR